LFLQLKKLLKPFGIKRYCTDGWGAYDDVRPASSDLAYMSGYSKGLRRKMADIQYQAEMLEAEGLAVEACLERKYRSKKYRAGEKRLQSSPGDSFFPSSFNSSGVKIFPCPLPATFTV
jgi:hypothetical protein